MKRIDKGNNELPALTLIDRRRILQNVLSALKKRFYAPEKLNSDWDAAVQRHRPNIENAESADIFEQAVTNLLAELRASHLGFFHAAARRASSKAALSATYLADDTSFGKRWIFQDVHPGGAASIAGIKPGDILLGANGKEVEPPTHPVFPMGEPSALEIIGANDNPRIATVEVTRPRGKKLQFVQPTLIESKVITEGIGYLKIAMFPGIIGVEVAREISRAAANLGAVDRLIVDLRGNTGGGIGALRVMSLLTPDKVPVGFALDKRRVSVNLQSEKQQFPRFTHIPAEKNRLWTLALRYGPAMITKKPVVLQTEGIGHQSFHGRVVILVNRHTASAAEMIVAFARENHLATIVGELTAGRLLSATSVKVGHGYRLALPTGAYLTWKGTALEGSPVVPDIQIEFDWESARAGLDLQLDCAVALLAAHLSQIAL